MSARPLFIGGTSSNAGKSWMTTAICAWLRGRGVRVAPFKAQNMSNHSFPCRDGGEIGRAQVAQAEACGLEPERAMNPILLKPNGDGTSQVVVNGTVWKTLRAREYYAHHDALMERVLEAYASLAKRFDAVIIEGAGSVSEINLREFDLVNLGLVTRLGSPWILVADIERGGVFASIVGTVALLTPEERSLLRGFAINKFRGDVSLFDGGREQLEARTGVHGLGVFPYDDSLQLDAEDSLSIARVPRRSAPPRARTAIVSLPRVSNATDFRLLDWAEWVGSPPAAAYDFIVLPGTKSTISDLEWLHRSGMAAWIVREYARGATVVGVCGGYQMLGREVNDPGGHETGADYAKGLGLIPAETTMAATKTTRVVTGVTATGTPCRGYEIHMGVTTRDADARAFARLSDGTLDGVRGDRVLGTYLHGVFEEPAVVADVFGVELPAPASKAEHYDRLGDWFAAHGRHLDELF